MKKPIFLLLLLFILAITGCSNSLSSANSKEAKIKVGIRSSELRTWEFIKEKAKKQGLDIELVNFSSAYDPNQALVEGEIDVNAFQHVAYLDLFNQKNGTDIVPIGTTIIAPLGLYSEKYKSLKDIPNGAQIAVPNDPSNWGRALVLLQEADLITVVEGFDGNGGEDKIKSNPKNLKIVPVDSASTPRVMQDTAASIINNGVAVEAGLSLKDALIHENKTAKPYINVIAARKKDQDKAYLKKLVKVYQSKSTAAFIKKTYKGNYIPTFISLKELNTYKDTYETK
ncbi:MetQ/NlpA family ABC transporter substrate-binding protein [Priestia aryabhattai]|uniref:MetQ/NlpA family ABC transporter substrate-binding protein n=1 Tax=Priestia TaxID=2800373 RepID=UPI0003AA03CB|nr:MULTISPECIES: MetQ/NlpA family ABC transporter substrate-binding protein [Priestia]MCL9634034.1 MetQ/NlpA family ABC transporter substrate-binding protein [Bacillus zanthoxyli]MBY0074092.1 MetQ/NlpA family ABC transporter substrate-binding protein [Priestia aryabhattai]MDT0147909.1 MetQ/NlpA family ABC transporter substrate-binding protein [Priestia aryabhattai]MDT0154225.1 MetQ/NlpA family ABC transporter substrate-binding protein [Priestia aryabhattai]MEB4870394.1 MetQ/NlpA family ABC tra